MGQFQVSPEATEFCRLIAKILRRGGITPGKEVESIAQEEEKASLQKDDEDIS